LRLKYRLYRLFWMGIDFLYPPICGGCGKRGERWCKHCQEELEPIPEPKCDLCGLPQKAEGICISCQKKEPAFSASRSWAVFGGPIQNALHRMKYRQDLGLGDALVATMLDAVDTFGWDIDLVVPVPLGKKRYKERGYNQAGLIARPLAWAKGWHYAPHVLRREKETISQVGLSAEEREINVRDAFFADREKVAGKNVLVVDDVSTTGATLNSCAKALRNGNAQEVYALSLARALPHHGLKTV